MPRYLTRGLQFALDLVVLSAAFWSSFLFRFEFSLPSSWAVFALCSWPIVVGLEYVMCWLWGVPSFSWRYVSMRETMRIAVAMMAAAAVLVLCRLAFRHSDGVAQYTVIPLGVLGSNLCVSMLGLVTVRATRRLYGEAMERRLRTNNLARDRVLLIGAGQAGMLVAREIEARPDLALKPVGFLDDDPVKVGTRIGGIPVLGKTVDIASIAERKRVKRVLITIANARGSEIRRITMACRAAGLETRIIPGIYEIVGEHVNLSRIREVAIEDLLGREAVNLDEDQVGHSIAGSVVMITGAGGSIGSELCRQVCRFAPRKLVLVDRFENALFEIHRELVDEFPGVAVEPRVADVCDVRRMESLFVGDKSQRAGTRSNLGEIAEFDGKPKIVFHAAAHKHVPMMESNPGEAIKNNIGGTVVVADLAHRFGVERFVFVSTDKAVNPTSVMGASKRVAEIYTQALSHDSPTRFVTVRFGNVLGSNGSAIPIFKEQIARGGPVTVTHPDMQRYFMTIPEAAQLVLQAGAMGNGGEIFILDMGKPVKMVDLARDLITLSGLHPDEDIEIQFIGIRPGEKLFEELATHAEAADKTKHAKILIGRVRPVTSTSARRSVDELVKLAETGDANALRLALREVVPEYNPSVPPPKISEEDVPRDRDSIREVVGLVASP